MNSVLLKSLILKWRSSIYNVLFAFRQSQWRIARVYFSSPGGSKKIEAARQGFKSALGFVKAALGRKLGLRYMPELEFYYDESFDYGAHIENLLDSIKTKS